MLVDDDEEFVSVLKRRFERRGLQVVTCLSAEAAAEAVQRHGPRVAIVDHVLPDSCGFELVKRLKDLQPGLQIVVLTGTVDAHAERAAREAGACRYLAKPCSLGDLEAAVAELS
jgi:ActR/RegA family two-component response regulator